jgi:hypothetical protein
MKMRLTANMIAHHLTAPFPDFFASTLMGTAG